MPAAAQTAYVVKVTRADPSLTGGEFVLLYAALTDTVEGVVERVGGALSAETITRLGLLYGQTLLL